MAANLAQRVRERARHVCEYCRMPQQFERAPFQLEHIIAARRVALQVESAVGPPSRPQFPHRRAGPLSLPHFHQLNRSPDGHSFYETDKRKSRNRP